MKTKRLVLACALAAGLASAVSAQTVSGYDITDAALSGFGGWAHTYNGTITTTGNDTANGISFTRGNYSGMGSGTLNDGGTNDGVGNAQLFGLTSSTSPSIVVYLDGTYFVDDITLWGFDNNNSIPGNVDGYDLTINGHTQSFGGTETNNDLFTTLAGSGLDSLQATSFTLSNFVLEGQSGWTEIFSISEITFSGRPVPAPGAFALLCLGGVASIRRRR